MDLNEKYSDVLAIIWNQIEEKNVKILNKNYLKTIVNLVHFMENDDICRQIVQYHNVSIIIEQLMILLYETNNIEFNIDELQQNLNDSMYLLKSQWLQQNLQKTRQKCCFLFSNK